MDSSLVVSVLSMAVPGLVPSLGRLYAYCHANFRCFTTDWLLSRQICTAVVSVPDPNRRLFPASILEVIRKGRPTLGLGPRLALLQLSQGCYHN